MLIIYYGVMIELTKERLEELLREAEKAHAEYERELGERDENWLAWYASYIINKIRK